MGHQPIAQIAAQPGLIERIRAERDRNPKMQRVFAVMRAYEDRMGRRYGWWTDEEWP
jgi:hypothetical protein